MPRRFAQSEGDDDTGMETDVVLGDALQLVVQETLEVQEQETERRHQEAMRRQDQDTERRHQEAMRRQEQEAERKLQEAMRRLEERVATALREAMGQLEQKLQEKDNTIHALEQRLEEMQERVASLEGRTRGSSVPGEERAVRVLEDRVQAVEASVQRALQEFFPRVDGLLHQLENPPPGAVSSFPSTSGNPCVVMSTGEAVANGRQEAPFSLASCSSSSASTSGSLAAAAACARAATATGAGAEAGDEQYQRELVELRIQGAKEKMRSARNDPSPLGEELYRAVAEVEPDEVRRLLDSGADVNYFSKCGSTPLIRAIVYHSNEEVVALLLQRGADVNDVNASGSSALHMVANLSGECVDMLLGAGSDINARSRTGATPLHNAVDLNNEEVVRALLLAGARRDLAAWDGPWKNKTPFDVARTNEMRDLLRM